MSGISDLGSIASYTMQIAQIKASASEAKKTGEKSFQEMVAEKNPGNITVGGTSGAGGVKTINPAEMTMEEYKDYVHHKIDYMVKNRHPSQALSSYAINISEDGFEAMKNDPEYENWVFNEALKKNLDFHDPWTAITGGSYHILNIGPTKETSNGQGWGVNFQKGYGGDIFDQQTGSSFYKNRVNTSAAEKKAKDYWTEKDRKRQRRLQEELDALWFKRKDAQVRLQEAWMEKETSGMKTFSFSENSFDTTAVFTPAPAAFMMPGLF